MRGAGMNNQDILYIARSNPENRDLRFTTTRRLFFHHEGHEVREGGHLILLVWCFGLLGLVGKAESPNQHPSQAKMIRHAVPVINNSNSGMGGSGRFVFTNTTVLP